MIRLSRKGLPPAADAWLKDRQSTYDTLRSAGDPVPASLEVAYRDDKVKPTLIAETGGKCAYCESKVLHVAYGDVEHLLPKASFPEYRLTYSNLTLVCGVCNNNKGDYHHPSAAVINPFDEEPADFLEAYGPYLAARKKRDRGLVTIVKLDLNRAELMEKRKERIDELLTLADTVERKRGAVKAVLLEALREETQADREYALVARALLEARGLMN